MPWPSDAETVTLTAATLATVTLDQDYGAVKIVHHGDAASAVYFTVDGAAPAVGGAGSDVLLSGDTVEVPAPGGSGASVVQLISSGAPTVTVAAGGR